MTNHHIVYTWPLEHEQLVRDIVDKVRRYIPHSDRDDIITIFALDYKGPDRPLSCSYCNKVLKHKSKTTYPYKDVPSIDHNMPCGIGGDNELLNLTLCCHECNIIKSTSDAESFMGY